MTISQNPFDLAEFAPLAMNNKQTTVTLNKSLIAELLADAEAVENWSNDESTKALVGVIIYKLANLLQNS